MTTTIGRATIASPGFAKPAPGNNLDWLDYMIFYHKNCQKKSCKNDISWAARKLLSSIANFLTRDWAEHPDRGENFQASLTICECLEKLQ